MSKKIKELELNALRKRFQGVKDYVVVEPSKVDATTDYNFRKTLRAKKVKCQLVKNSLAKKVLEENGVALDGSWVGPTLLCWGADSVKALATTVDTAIKESKKDPKAPDKYKVKTAVAEGQRVPFDVAKTLPTRQEAIGEILAAVLGPASAIAGCLVGPANQLAGCLAAIEEKNKGQEGAAPAAAG
jgi:large subunit ribosomal protein L10